MIPIYVCTTTSGSFPGISNTDCKEIPPRSPNIWPNGYSISTVTIPQGFDLVGELQVITPSSYESNGRIMYRSIPGGYYSIVKAPSNIKAFRKALHKFT